MHCPLFLGSIYNRRNRNVLEGPGEWDLGADFEGVQFRVRFSDTPHPPISVLYFAAGSAYPQPPAPPSPDAEGVPVQSLPPTNKQSRKKYNGGGGEGNKSNNMAVYVSKLESLAGL